METLLSADDKAFYARLKTSRTLITEPMKIDKSTAWDNFRRGLLEKSALACADKEKMYTEYTSNLVNLDTRDTGSQLSPSIWNQYPVSLSKQYTQYTVLFREKIWQKIHSDSVFVTPLEWAKKSPEGLKHWNSKIAKWYCLQFGFLFVKSVLQRVAGRHDYYFTGQGCLESQRIRLCRHILDTEGIKIGRVS